MTTVGTFHSEPSYHLSSVSTLPVHRQILALESHYENEVSIYKLSRMLDFPAISVYIPSKVSS